MRVVMIWECSVINKIKKNTPQNLILTTLLTELLVLRTPAIISQVFSTTFCLWSACFALPQCFSESFPAHFLLTGLLRASHSRNPF